MEAKDGKVKLSFVSETPCVDFGVKEILVSTPEAADLTRFNNGLCPLLFNHDNDKILGKIEKIYFENKKGYAEVTFDKDEKSQIMYDKVQRGSLKGTSIRCRPTKTMYVAPGESWNGYEGECDVITNWELIEISLVSLPADPDVGVGRALKINQKEIEVPMAEKELENMAEEKKIPTPIVDEKARALEIQKAAEDAVTKERARVQGITDLCRKYEIESDKYVADNEMTVDKVRGEILDVLAERNKPLKASVTKDEADKFREFAADGMAFRCGVSEAKEGNKFTGMSLRALADECLERGGEKGTRYLDNSEMFDKLCTRAMGSSQFWGISADVMHKAMMNAYAEAPITYKALCSVGVNTDFKPNHKVEIGLGGLPVQMSAESGEFTYLDETDGQVSTSLHTYGKGIKFTREIFVNDNLGELTRIIGLTAGGFQRIKEIMFYNLLTLSDNYSSANKNLVSTNKTLSVKGLSEGRKLMRKQKDLSGNGYIAIAPKFLIVPAAIETEAEELLNSTADPASSNANVRNPWNNKLTLVSSPYLDDHSEAAYYLAAAPNMAPGIEYTTLNGKQEPTMRVVYPSETLGVAYQLYEDFGFTMLSYKGFVKNPNA